MKFHQLFTLISIVQVSLGEEKYGARGVELGGSNCWREECVLGNLIADSMLYCAYAEMIPAKYPGMGSTDVIGMWDSGSMARQDFTLDGDVTPDIIEEWLRKDRNASFAILKGRDLRRMFELSGTALNQPHLSFGQFLHVSQNVRISYRVPKKGGQAVFSGMRVKCGACESGVWNALDDDYSYHVVVPSMGYLDLEASITSNGGVVLAHATIGSARDCIDSYIGHMTNLTAEAIPGGRIEITQELNSAQDPQPEKFVFEIHSSNTSFPEIVLLSFTVLLLVGLLVLGVLNISRFGRFENPFYQRSSSYASTQALNPNIKA